MEPINKPQGGIAYYFPPFLRVYKDGTVERLLGTEIVPPSEDPATGVSSKDVVINPDVSARLYLPKITNPQAQNKFPLLVYYHGGGFCIETAFSPTYHHYLTSLTAEANVVVVSVDYRRAPEHPIPTAHEDSWVALKWALSHSNGQGQEPWISNHVDFNRVYLSGDSAGANISHHMAIRVGISEELSGVKLCGVVLVHPYFSGIEPVGLEGVDKATGDKKAVGDRLWALVCPSSTGCDDPLINPAKEPNLSRLGCKRLLVCVAGKDYMKHRGWYYYEKLKKSGWEGVAEIMETEGEHHLFHLFKPTCEKAMELMQWFVSFLKICFCIHKSNL